uniref:Uncharacterized protein LOC113785374 n=1 Tax=Cicer arietinum TaxID=3827 RepID=A0A3Q7YCG0_CICAR|nr:uncharacterized protein LOC113785374 [Cicer arietinum]
MGRREMKNIVMIVVMIMTMVVFDFAKGDDDFLRTNDTKSTIGEIICMGKCAVKCRRVFAIRPVYIACVGACGLLTCHKTLSKEVYDCTTSCASPKFNEADFDDRAVNSIMNTCLESCKSK